MKRLFFIVVTIVATLTATAQRKVTLDLNRTVALATDSSLAAEKYRSVLDTYRFAFLAIRAIHGATIHKRRRPRHLSRTADALQ